MENLLTLYSRQQQMAVTPKHGIFLPNTATFTRQREPQNLHVV